MRGPRGNGTTGTWITLAGLSAIGWGASIGRRPARTAGYCAMRTAGLSFSCNGGKGPKANGRT